MQSLVWTELTSFFLDMASYGSSLSARSHAHVGSALPIMDLVHMGSSMFVHSFVCLDSASPAFGRHRMGASVFVSDHLHLRLSLILRSVA